MLNEGASESVAGSVPWCSLITVTYNSSRALTEFWDHGERLPDGVEWIVVDNGSTDDSAEVAERAGARVIRLAQNLGFSAANNAGFAASSGSFIGFVNPDVRVQYGDLKILQATAKSEDAIVGPQLLNADGTRQPNGRGFPILGHKVLNRLGRESQLEGSYLLYAESTLPRSVCWLMGAAVFGEREAINKFGAWDPHFFLYYEDKDFSLRAWNAGLRVMIEPRAQWTHGWARETKGLNAMPWRRELASMAKFYARYPEFLISPALAANKHKRINNEVYGDVS